MKSTSHERAGPRLCIATRVDGNPCLGPAQFGQAYCHCHNPDGRSERMREENRKRREEVDQHED